MFDYRYSRLPLVFGSAIREGYMNEESLASLSEEKLEAIRSLLATFSRGNESVLYLRAITCEMTL